MFSFFSEIKPAFGLDISFSSIKFMELHKQGSRAAVKCYCEKDIPKTLIVNDVITDGKVFQHYMQEAFNKPQFGRLGTKYAVVSLSESKSFVRVIQIPKMSDAEAENAIPFEAESFIPLPIDQVYLDWQKLGAEGDKMNILILASPKDYVDGYLGFLEDAGLKVAAFEVESQSCIRALLPKDSPEACLVLDLGESRSSLIMSEGGNLKFTSTIPVAGNTFTESIAKALGVSSGKAEEIKKIVGIANTAEYPNITTSLLPVLNNLTAGAKNILKFNSEHSGSQVSRILLTGGTARLKNLVDFLTPEFTDMPNLKLQLGDPWTNLNLAKPPLNSEDSLGFTTVIGLAMRAANL